MSTALSASPALFAGTAVAPIDVASAFHHSLVESEITSAAAFWVVTLPALHSPPLAKSNPVKLWASTCLACRVMPRLPHDTSAPHGSCSVRMRRWQRQQRRLYSHFRLHQTPCLVCIRSSISSSSAALRSFTAAPARWSLSRYCDLVGSVLGWGQRASTRAGNYAAAAIGCYSRTCSRNARRCRRCCCRRRSSAL
jgi:hypothetical protein